METVQYKISLDSLKTHFHTTVPTYVNNEEYKPQYNDYDGSGKIPSNIRLKDYNSVITDGMGNYSKANLSFLSVKDGNNDIIQFKTLEHFYHLLKKYIESCSIYTLCRRGQSYIWVERVFEDKIKGFFDYINNILITDELPDENTVVLCNEKDITQDLGNATSYGKVYIYYYIEDQSEKLKTNCWNGLQWVNNVCVTPFNDELYEMINNIGIESLKAGFFLSDSLLNGKLSYELCKPNSLIPYCGINLCLTSDGKELGNFEPYIDEWIPNKKYYLGDKVIYNGKVYTLSESDDWSGYDKVKINSTLYELLLNNDADDISITVSDNEVMYFKNVPYYTGHFNETTKLTEFDDLDGKHWIEDTINGKPTPIKTSIESQIEQMERLKTSFDENGLKLPFNVIYGSVKTEIRYLLGIAKVHYNNNVVLYDTLDSISFYSIDENGVADIVKTYTYTSNNGTTRDDLICRGDVAIGVADIEAMEKKPSFIRFVYHIGKTDGNENGILYDEIHPIAIDTFYCNYEGFYAWITCEPSDEAIDVLALPTANGDIYGKIFHYMGNDVTYKTNGVTYYKLKKGEYYKSVSPFTYVNVDYKHFYHFDDDGKLLLTADVLSNVQYTASSNYNNNSYELNGFYDSSMIGIFDKKINSDVHIDRGSGEATAFERHGALSEVNTFSDLLNYKNNLFEL